MSTILKALRRLEREKTQQLHRPLREEVASGSEPGRTVSIPLVAVAVFAAGLAIGAVVLFLWPWPAADLPSEPELAAREPGAQRPAERREAPRRERPSPSDRPPTTILAPEPVRAPAPLDLPAAALVSEVEVVRRIAPPPLSLNEEAISDDEPRPPRPGELRPGAEALKPKRARPPTSAARAEPPEPAPSVATPAARRAPPATPDVGAATKPPESPPAPAQPLASEPPAPRPAPAPERVAVSPVPEILVSRTYWHPQSDRREAFLQVGGEAETLRVREGDSVGSLVVHEIEPSGVIFQRDGEELRHAVGTPR